MKRTVVLMVSLMIVIVSAAQNKSKSTKPATSKPAQKTSTAKSAGAANVGLKSPLDSFSYAMGMSVGKFYKQQGLTSINKNLMLQGIGDAMNEKSKPKMDEMQANMCIQSYVSNIKMKQVNGTKTEGKHFLDSVAKLPGVVKLPSGLQYKVITAGKDTMHPKVTDTVKFNYRGALANGTEFDNSYKRGEPLIHPVNQLVPGMTEALQLMTPGSKWMLYIPSELGYGDSGAGEVIPPGALIVFELELLEIVNKH
jgi:FKBP-type peptidyl-prolyl cis-trans isomerase FklB